MRNFFKQVIGYVTGVIPNSKKEIEDAMTEEYHREIKSIEQELEEAQQPEVRDRPYCVFLLNDDNTVSIDFHFTKGTNSGKFGEMLYHINNGDLVPWVVKMLNNVATQNPHLSAPIQGVFDGWYEQISKKDSVIKPSQVFQNQSEQ